MKSFQAFPDSGCGAHRLWDLNSPAMNRFVRRVLIGGAAGAIGTFFLASALPGRMIAVGLGLVLFSTDKCASSDRLRRYKGV
jgi:hypothetical protein